MSQPTTKSPALSCPFCRTELRAGDAVCSGCQARRQVRSGMSPSSFAWYVATWALLAVPTVLLALWIALLPWLPHGETPGYAMALVGARPVDPVPRCRVEVIDASGRRSQVLKDGACGKGAATTAPSPAERQAALTTQRMAAALHSALTLLAALLACWGLLRGLRRPFLQHSAPSWVRRVAA